MRKIHKPLLAALAVPTLLVTACSSTPSKSAGAGTATTAEVAVRLNAAGCDPGGLTLPSGPLKLTVINQGDTGEFKIQNQNGDVFASIGTIEAGRTVQVPVDLKPGYYTVECGSDETMAELIVGNPTTAKLDLGSVAFPTTLQVAPGYTVTDGNSYTVTNLVATSAAYKPQIVDPDIANAWGIANRPAGKGGHWWVIGNATGNSVEYVGDVGGVPLHSNNLRVVTVPGKAEAQAGAPADASAIGQPTGVIFNPTTGFTVDQGPVQGPAKFLFASADGTISAWTEQVDEDGVTTQLGYATKVVDNSKADAQYFGLAITPNGQRLLVADFGSQPGIKSFDQKFAPVPTQGFANPFVTGTPKPFDLLPWNVTTVGDKVYVSYASVGASEAKAGGPSFGEEYHKAGAGKIVQYDTNGKLLKILDDKGSLDAPWGLTLAPKGFGKLTGHLLAANFGDGTISAFNADGAFVDYVRGSDGKPVVVPGVWGLLPGNGASLGAADAVYFTAGPRGEQDGVFGRLNAGK